MIIDPREERLKHRFGLLDLLRPRDPDKGVLEHSLNLIPTEAIVCIAGCIKRLLNALRHRLGG